MWGNPRHAGLIAAARVRRDALQVRIHGRREGASSARGQISPTLNVPRLRGHQALPPNSCVPDRLSSAQATSRLPTG